MCKLIFYIFFGCSPVDSSKIYIFNGSSTNYYLLVPRNKSILVSKEIPNYHATFLRFSYFKNNYIQVMRKTSYSYSCLYDTIFVDRHSDVNFSFRAFRNNGSDTIPIQNMFWLQLSSARVGVIRKNGKKYYALKSKNMLFYDHRNFICSPEKVSEWHTSRKLY